jgi:cytochrome c-type biogenesis protein CcmH/NrfG
MDFYLWLTHQIYCITIVLDIHSKHPKGGFNMARRRGARRTARRTTRRTVRRTRRRRRRRRVLVGGFVVLAASGAYAAVKLSQQDAQRIEEHTGYPPEDLEDADLNQAMQELNIQSQPLTDEDQAALSQGGDAPAAKQPASASEESYLEELEKLGELRDKGIITDEEFEAKKKELLGL